MALGAWLAVGATGEGLRIRRAAVVRGPERVAATAGSGPGGVGELAQGRSPARVASPAPVPSVKAVPTATLGTMAAVIQTPTPMPLPFPAPDSLPATAADWESITPADLARITFDELPPDDSYIVPLAKGLDQLSGDDKKRLNNFEDKLAYWPPGKGDDPVQRLRNLLSVCAVADLTQDPNEGEIAYAVLDEIQGDFAPDRLTKMTAWLILHPAEGTVMNNAGELGIDGEAVADQTRDRVVAYAKKLLLRLLGKPLPARDAMPPAPSPAP